MVIGEQNKKEPATMRLLGMQVNSELPESISGQQKPLALTTHRGLIGLPMASKEGFENTSGLLKADL